MHLAKVGGTVPLSALSGDNYVGTFLSQDIAESLKHDLTPDELAETGVNPKNVSGVIVRLSDFDANGEAIGIDEVWLSVSANPFAFGATYWRAK